MLRQFCLGLAAALLSILSLPAPFAKAEDKPGNFDFYVLSLSWSPTFCDSKRAKNSPEQCGDGKHFGFIVHGLWPQFENGYPETCATTEPRKVPDALGRDYFDIMPSMGLIGHEWRKHGSCSGLSQKAYLETTRAAFNKVKLPADLATVSTSQTYSAEVIEQKFIDANPGLREESIAVNCEGQRLEEVRICLTKELAFRPCKQVDAGGCKLKRITVPPTP